MPEDWKSNDDNKGQGNNLSLNSLQTKTKKILQKEPKGHQKNNKTKNKNIKINTVGGPDGQGQRISRLYAQSLPDPGPDDHDSENLTKGWKMKFKQNNINAYFCSKTTIDFELEMRRLEREKLLEMKRRKELAWTERRRELKEEL